MNSLKKIYKKYKLNSIINILYLKFLLDTNNLIFFNEKKLEKFKEEILNFDFEDIIYLYDLFFYKKNIKKLLMFENNKELLKNIQNLNNEEKEIFIIIFKNFKKLIEKYYFTYLNKKFYLNNNIIL